MASSRNRTYSELGSEPSRLRSRSIATSGLYRPVGRDAVLLLSSYAAGQS